jgi:hypothetical protein
MTDPLKFINRYRARSAQRPLDPNKPSGQVEPWTQFDIEHYALDLGWEPPPAYKLARDPRKLLESPFEWWREFFSRYYRPDSMAGYGNISISYNFGGSRGLVYMGEMIRDAEIDPSPALRYPWPRPGSRPAQYHEIVVKLLQSSEESFKIYQGVRWPLDDGRREDMINYLGGAFGRACPPQNLTQI